MAVGAAQLDSKHEWRVARRCLDKRQDTKSERARARERQIERVRDR